MHEPAPVIPFVKLFTRAIPGKVQSQKHISSSIISRKRNIQSQVGEKESIYPQKQQKYNWLPCTYINSEHMHFFLSHAFQKLV